MYLRFHVKISPQRVARLLQPGVADEDLEVDYENVYEWAYIDLPGVPFSLNVSRDHGMSELEDSDWELPDEELETFAGPTYVIGWDRKSNVYIQEIPDRIIQLLCEETGSAIIVYPGRINIDAEDPEPVAEYGPKAS